MATIARPTRPGAATAAMTTLFARREFYLPVIGRDLDRLPDYKVRRERPPLCSVTICVSRLISTFTR